MARCSQCGRALPGFSFKKTCDWCALHERAQRGEDSDIQPVMPKAWEQSATSSDTSVTLAILVINLMVFVAMVIAGASPINPDGERLLHFGANYGPYVLQGEWWRLASHMFVHIGLIHLAFNMFFLYSLGRDCERLFGSLTYAAIYAVSGIAGGVAAFWCHPFSISAGASGALFGILGAMIAVFKFGSLNMPRALVEYNLRQMLMCAGFNLVFGLTTGFVDNAAHIGGLVAGFMLGALVARIAPDRGAYVRRFASVALVSLIVGGAAWSVSRTNADLADETTAHFKQMVREHPKDPTAHAMLAQVYRAHEKFDLAEQEFTRAIDLTNDARMKEALRFAIAQVWESSKPEQARAFYNDLLRASPNSADAHAGLGRVAANEKNHGAAIVEFQKAIELDPKLPGTNFDMGRSLTELKRYDEAIAAYQNEQKLAQEDPDYDGPDVQEALQEVQHLKSADAGKK